MANPQKPSLGRSQRRCQSEPSNPSPTCQYHHRHDHDAESLSQQQHQYQRNPPVPVSVTSPAPVRQQSLTSPSIVQFILGSENTVVSHEDVDVDMFQRMDIDDDPVSIPSLHPSYQLHDMEHRPAFVDSDPCSIHPPLSAPTETFIEYASPPLPSSPFGGFSRSTNMNMNMNTITSSFLNGFGHWAASSTSSATNITSGNVLSNTPASGPWSLNTAGAPSPAIQAALLQDLNQPHPLITSRLDGHQEVVVTTTTTTSSQPQSPSLLLSLSTTPNSNFHSSLAIPARTTLFGQPVFGTTSQIPHPNSFTPHSPFSGAEFGRSSTFGSVSLTSSLSLPTVLPSPDPFSSILRRGSGRPLSESTFSTVVTAGPSFGFPSSAVALSNPAFGYSSPNTLSFTTLPSAPTTLPDVTIETTTTTAVTIGQEALTTASPEVVIPDEIPTTTAPSSPALVFFGPVFVTELYNTPPSTPPAVEGFFDLQQLPPAPHFVSLYSNLGFLSPPIQQADPVDLSGNVNNGGNSSSINSNIINNTDPAPISNGNSTLAPVNNSDTAITPIDSNNSTSTPMSTHLTLSSDGTLPLNALRRVDLNLHEHNLQQRRRRRLALTRRRCIDETETGYNTDMDTELSSTDEDLCQRVVPRSRRHQPSYSSILSECRSSSSGGRKSAREERDLVRQLERRERFLRFRSLFDEFLDTRNQRKVVANEVDRRFDWFKMSDVPRRQARVPTPAFFAASSGSRSTTTTSTPSLERLVPISSSSSTSGPSAAVSFRIKPSLPASGITSSTAYQEWLALVTSVDVSNIHSTEETSKFQERLSSTLLQERRRFFAAHDVGLDEKPLNKTTPRPATSSTSYFTSALSPSSSSTAKSRDAYGTSLLNNRSESPQSIEQQDPQNQTPNPNAESLFVFTMHTPPRRSARISGGASSSTSSNNPSLVAQPIVTPTTTTAAMTTPLVSSIPSTATTTPIAITTRPTTRSKARQQQIASTSTLGPIQSHQGTSASPQGLSLARRISHRLRRHLRFNPTLYIRYFFQNHSPRRAATNHPRSGRPLAGPPLQEPLIDNVDLNWRKDYYEKAPKSRVCKQRRASMSIEVAEKEAHEKEHRLMLRLRRIEDQNSRVEKRARRELLLNGWAMRRNKEEREKERRRELWMDQDDYDVFGRFEKDRLEQEKKKRRAATSANRSLQGTNLPLEASTNTDTLNTSADTPLPTTSSRSVPISSLSPQSIDQGTNSSPFQNLSVEDQFKQLIYLTKQRVKAMEYVEEEEPLIRRSSRQRVRSERTRTVSASSHTPVNSLSTTVEEQDHPSDINPHTVMSSPITVFSATDKGKGKKVHDNRGEFNIPDERSLVHGWHKTLQEQRMQHDVALARTLQEVEDCEAEITSSSPFAGDEALARRFQEAEDLDAILSSSSSSPSTGDEALARELQKQEEEDQAAEEKMKGMALADREQLLNDEALARRFQHEEVDDDELRREIKAKRALLDDASSTSSLSLPSPSFSCDSKGHLLPAEQTSVSDEQVSPPPVQSSGASPSLTPSSTHSSSPPSRSSRSSQSSRVPHSPYSRPSSSPPSLISFTGVLSSPPPPPSSSPSSPPPAQPPSTTGDHNNAHNPKQQEYSASGPNFACEVMTTTLSTANTTGTIACTKRTRKTSSSVQVKRHSLRVQERKDFKKHYMSLEG